MFLHVFVGLTAILFAVWHFVGRAQNPSVRGDVLFVFAHPDDEAMFFSPLLYYLKKQGVICHFLCLSNGNFNGLGTIREGELHSSAAYFGMQSRNVKVVHDSQLQDGMAERWPPSLVMKEVKSYLEKSVHISTVVTFDAYGISSHPNHIAVHEGVKKLKHSMPPGIIFLQLKTRNIISKYTSIVSLVPYLLRPSEGTRKAFTVIIPLTAVYTCACAMAAHASQLVWFRYLFIAFSSYSYINELTEIV